MRIAIVGSHATGKSTLVAELAQRDRSLVSVDEPYYELLAAGHVFGDAPTVDDFETLFDASVSTLSAQRDGRVVFDRSPADYLAYLVALEPSASHVDRVATAGAALETLDLIVYVPIEAPDRVAHAEHPRLRRRVDAILRGMLIEQSWGWSLPVIEVRGTPSERLRQIADHLFIALPR